MERFGQGHVLNGLNGPGIHRLQNVMTLDTGIHQLFDRLDIWLEPTVSSFY